MRPTPRITFPKGLFAFVLSVIVLLNVLPQFIHPTHEDQFDTTVQTRHFTYRVSTFTNTQNQRCALIRCGQQYANRLHHRSMCDIIFVEVIQANYNSSFRLCPVDYIYTQWNTLSRTYNHGFYYLSDDVQLRMPVSDLPLDGKAIHLSATEDSQFISLTWMAVKPSHLIRTFFEDWHKAIDNTSITNPNRLSPDILTLNNVRSCHSADVVCHSRAAVIAWQCNFVRNEAACMARTHPLVALQLVSIALTVVVIISTIVATIGTAIPRMKGALGTPLNAHLVSIPLTYVMMIVLVIVFAGEDWVVIVKNLSRVFGVVCKHDLKQESFNAPAEIFRAVPDLRGLYSGYSYVFRDTFQTVRITGPATSLVVASTSVVLYIKRILYEGLLVKSLAIIVVVRLACNTIIKVSGIGKEERTTEDDEYIQFRSEIPLEASKIAARERSSRTFLTPRERPFTMSKST